jgi:hypothetical protein
VEFLTENPHKTIRALGFSLGLFSPSLRKKGPGTHQLRMHPSLDLSLSIFKIVQLASNKKAHKPVKFVVTTMGNYSARAYLDGNISIAHMQQDCSR